MISCNEAVKQLWEFLDGEMDETRRRAMEEHLAFCRRCCGEVEFAEELQRFLAEHGTEDVPADALRRLTGVLDQLEEAT